MGADCAKVLAQCLPYFAPHKPNSAHIEVGNLNQALQRELPRVVCVVQFFLGDQAQVGDEVYDSLGVQVYTALDNQVYLVEIDVLDDKL